MYMNQQSVAPATHFSIDVECVATGRDHNARAVAQISLVDQYEQVILNLYVRPQQPVVSYLTPLTGLTRELLDEQGVPLEEAQRILRQYLPRHGILVGQNIGKDVDWLQLKEGQDYESLVDLSGVYRVWNSKYKTWSVFGQDHLAKVLLGWDSQNASHDAVGDAIKSIRLFNLYNTLKADPKAWQQAQETVMAAEVQPSFAKRNPEFDGVCMGNRRQCKCGAPFLG
ncbi:hypothetical protein WJX75_003286 [Coccomyxa subellipsoidea]|uniref:Exonuclease domain-containing protein n=1 Tax=Coccomyxa subellipsoidea TaxID=248742 RepID=A0ABR2YPE7_9CHLO